MLEEELVVLLHPGKHFDDVRGQRLVRGQLRGVQSELSTELRHCRSRPRSRGGRMDRREEGVPVQGIRKKVNEWRLVCHDLRHLLWMSQQQLQSDDGAGATAEHKRGVI